ALNRMHDLTDNVTVNGTFLFKGQDIYAPSTDTVELRKDIGMVFQQPNPFPFSIYDNVAFGLRISGEKNKAVLDEMVETSLKQAAIWNEVKDDLHKSALSLSGGQQQRVGAARALVHEPALIFGDEPTGALDSENAREMMNYLTKINDERDISIVMVTHDPFSASFASRILFLTDGQITKTLTRDDRSREDFYNYVLSELGNFE
ncbi:MAG TPA: phosphate ABC transporter ATP-binding protein, partial [Weissella confusa]|nr:phosphate ABC transporter ATP-binding protein [Weissella confusa]